eukprot:184127_1
MSTSNDINYRRPSPSAETSQQYLYNGKNNNKSNVKVTVIEMSPPNINTNTRMAPDEFEVIGDEVATPMEDEDVSDHPSDDDILLPPPTDAHAIHVTPGGPDDDLENNNMFHLHVGKQGTKEFGRMIGDDAMAQSMVMDDILDEMNMDFDGNDDFDAIAQAMAQSKFEMKVNKKG